MKTIRMFGTLLLAGVCSMAMAQRSGNDLFQQALMKERSQGDLKGAVEIYQRIVKEFASDRRLAARALLEMARCQEKQGGEHARRTYERLLKEFSDQAEQAAEARSRMAALAVPASTTSPRVRQLWAGANVEPMGSISPDGRWLTYANWETGDLGLRDLLNNTSKLLTNTGGWEKSNGQFAQESRFSPDGKMIAYNWFVPPKGYELRVMNADGSGVRTLGWAGVLGYYVRPGAWSSDGRLLAVSHYDVAGLKSLHVVTVSSGEKRELIPAGRIIGGATSFSPDGKWLVLQGWQSDSSGDLFTLPVAGGKPEPFVTHPSNDGWSSWSADGRSVLFLSDRSGSYGLWQVAVENGRAAGPPELVRDNLGSNVWPVGLTKSGSFAYSVRAGGQDIYVADIDPAAGNVTGKPVMLSDRHPGYNSAPRLSPDGTRLAYLTQVGGSREPSVTMRDLATSAERTLTLPPYVFDFVWTPDGSRLLLESGAPALLNAIQLFWLEVDSGQLTLFRTVQPTVQPARNRLSPQFSDDGKTLYMLLRERPEEAFAVVALDVASGHQKTLYKATFEKGLRGGLALSPDGRWLAATRRDGGRPELILVPTGGGEPRVVAGYRADSGRAAPVFSLDGKSVFVYRQNSIARAAPVELIRIDLSTGAIESAGLNLPGLQSVQVHPSGRKIFFQAGRLQQEIWIADNILPRNGR